MKRLKTALIWTLAVIVIRIFIATPSTEYSFSLAVAAFSFRTLDSNYTCILLATVSILMPIILLTILLHDIYRTHYTFGETVKIVILNHVFYGYLALSCIYILDLIRDKYFASLHTDPKDGTSEWNKYILHFVLTLPLFVDSVYSVEVERIRTNNKRYNPRNLTFSLYIHYIAQVVFGAYLLYALMVVLFINNDFDFTLVDLIKYKDPEKTAVVFGHVRTLAKEVIWCVFVSLSMGLVDQWISFQTTDDVATDGCKGQIS